MTTHYSKYGKLPSPEGIWMPITTNVFVAPHLQHHSAQGPPIPAVPLAAQQQRTLVRLGWKFSKKKVGFWWFLMIFDDFGLFWLEVFAEQHELGFWRVWGYFKLGFLLFRPNKQTRDLDDLDQRNTGSVWFRPNKQGILSEENERC